VRLIAPTAQFCLSNHTWNSEAQNRLQHQEEVTMSFSSTITLIVPRAETESLFLTYVVQAAIRAYRNDVIQSDNMEVDCLEEHQSADNFRSAVKLGLKKSRWPA
jgi:hypothetical protein